MINTIKDCTLCTLCKNQKPLIDNTLTECDIMWVGISAKKVENIDINYPLKNDTNSGKIIEMIEKQNNHLTFYKSNLVKCLPLDENGKIRYPSIDEMNTCIVNLIKEIDIVKPKKIVCLGSKTYEFISKYFKDNYINIDAKLYKIEHPSYIYIYKRKDLDIYLNKVCKILNSD